jgi:IS5 family transposase
MQPKSRSPQCELFGARLSELLNPEHPLYVLAERLDWSQFDAAIDACYAEELGRPGVNTRLMVGLLYLKHAFDESDESLVARWVENPYWQFFCGCQYMQHELPIDPSSLSRWRKRVGAERLEKLLAATVHAALAMKALRPQELQKLNVDTTVQEKAIAFPTDARLYHKMRVALVRRAQSLGIRLRQNYRFQGKKLLARQGRYAAARQLKRAAKMTRQLKTILGRVLRDIGRKAGKIQGQIADEPLRELVALAERLLEQTRTSKHKIYSVHAPEVECLAKGKAHKRYEFGCKTSVATTSRRRDRTSRALHRPDAPGCHGGSRLSRARLRRLGQRARGPLDSQTSDPRAASHAQTSGGYRADDRPPQERQPPGSQLSDRSRRRPNQRAARRRRVQPP